MSSKAKKSNKALRLIRRTMAELKAPFQIVDGAKHYRILLGGKTITVVSNSRYFEGDRGEANTMALLRRAAKEYHDLQGRTAH